MTIFTNPRRFFHKSYQIALSANLSPEGRKILLSTNWEEVEDRGYWNVKYYRDLILELNKQPRKNKDHIKVLFKEANKLLKYLEKQGGKNPNFMDPINRKFNMFRKRLLKQLKNTSF